MKFFISWSGGKSREFAVFFERWIKDVHQGIDTFISTSDIGVGDDWRKEIDAELEENSFGVLVLTPDNIRSPWLHYEAGALSKTSEVAKIMPIRVGVSHLDLQSGPLSKFQNVDASKEGIKRLVFSINELSADGRIEEERLTRVFERWWDEFESFLSDFEPKGDDKDDASDDKIEQIEDLIGSLAFDIRKMSENFNNLRVLDNDDVKFIKSIVEKTEKMRLKLKHDVSESELKEFADRLGFFESKIEYLKTRKGDKVDIWIQLEDLF